MTDEGVPAVGLTDQYNRQITFYNGASPTTPEHEVNHFLGMSHSGDSKSVMCPGCAGRLPYLTDQEMHNLVNAYR